MTSVNSTSAPYSIGLDSQDSFIITNEEGKPNFVLDSFGRRMLPNQPYFDAYGSKNTNFLVTDKVVTLVFDKAVANINNYYDAAKGIFTAPVQGLYQFSATVFIYDTNQQLSAGSGISLLLQIGSRAYEKVCQLGTSLGYGISCSIAHAAYMNATQAASIGLKYAAGSSTPIPLTVWGHPTTPPSYFSGYLLG